MAERIVLDDPNADLFGMNEEGPSDEEFLQLQLYEKNPRRVSAMADLWYEAMIKEIDSIEDLPEEAKRKMIFSMTANGVLDMMSDASPEELGLEISLCFDTYLGLMLTNKKFKVDIIKEHRKALLGVKEEDFPNREMFEMELEAFEEGWWDIPQPLLDKRTPNDAIKETLTKYGLTE
jgi:hypothetical protein